MTIATDNFFNPYLLNDEIILWEENQEVNRSTHRVTWKSSLMWLGGLVLITIIINELLRFLGENPRNPLTTPFALVCMQLFYSPFEKSYHQYAITNQRVLKVKRVYYGDNHVDFVDFASVSGVELKGNSIILRCSKRKKVVLRNLTTANEAYKLISETIETNKKTEDFES